MGNDKLDVDGRCFYATLASSLRTLAVEYGNGKLMDRESSIKACIKEAVTTSIELAA